MKVFLSSLEVGPDANDILEQIPDLRWNLMSYFYIRKNRALAQEIKRRSDLIMIDSGAHSFQKGAKVEWEAYTEEYAEFIKAFDEDKVLGYFEMDVDNIIGYDRVLELRRILEGVTDKVIPVWHRNRGVDDFERMCREYSGRIIGITGFRNEDIQDHQYLMFLRQAKDYGCKVHCLGMTRRKILDKVPFDFVDSSSWKQQAIYGRIGSRKVSMDFSRESRGTVMVESYRAAMDLQDYYYKRWLHICGE